MGNRKLQTAFTLRRSFGELERPPLQSSGRLFRRAAHRSSRHPPITAALAAPAASAGPPSCRGSPRLSPAPAAPAAGSGSRRACRPGQPARSPSPRAGSGAVARRTGAAEDVGQPLHGLPKPGPVASIEKSLTLRTGMSPKVRKRTLTAMVFIRTLRILLKTVYEFQALEYLKVE